MLESLAPSNIQNKCKKKILREHGNIIGGMGPIFASQGLRSALLIFKDEWSGSYNPWLAKIHGTVPSDMGHTLKST